MPERTYTEEEVADLFKRAAELQSRREDASDPASSHQTGLTLDELTAIAADAGLDPEHLRLAAAEMEPRGRRRKAETRVSSAEIVAERWIRGQLDDDAREDIVAELRHRYEKGATDSMWTGSYGASKVQTVGRSLEWQYTNPWWGTHTRVLVQPRDEGVRVRVTQNNVYSGTATGWSASYAPFIALALGFIAAPAAGSWAIGVAVALITLAVLIPTMTAVSSRTAEKRRSEVEALAEAVVAHVTPAPPVAEAPEAGVRSEPRLDLPESPSEEGPAAAPSRVRQR